jgi:hypothetical protein
MLSGTTAYNQRLVWKDDRIFYTSRYQDKSFGEVQQWDFEKRALLKGFGDPWGERPRSKEQSEYSAQLAIFPELDRLLCVSSKGAVYGYSLDGKLKWSLPASSYMMAFYASNDAILVLESKKPESLRWILALDGSVQQHPNMLPEITRAAISKDGRYLAGAEGSELVVLNLQTGFLDCLPLGCKPYQLAFSPDCTRLALGMEDGSVQIIKL